jgi:hypothetical protein
MFHVILIDDCDAHFDRKLVANGQTFWWYNEVTVDDFIVGIPDKAYRETEKIAAIFSVRALMIGGIRVGRNTASSLFNYQLELTADERRQFIEEMTYVASVLDQTFTPDKMN